MHDPKDSIKEGYEVTDMNIRLILISLAGLAVMTIAGLVTIIIVMRGFEESRGPMNTGKASPLAAADSQHPPEGPILQQDPVADKVVVLEAAFAQLGSYGVVSDTPGHERVHIPIHRAIELVGAGTVPYRQAAVTAAISEAAH